MAWSEKRVGFQSSKSGNCRWGRTGPNLPPDFEQWRLGLLMWLVSNKVQYYETEDRSIVTNVDGITYVMSPAQQKQNHQSYVRKWRGNGT